MPDMDESELQTMRDYNRRDAGFAILGVILFAVGFALSQAAGAFSIVAVFGLLVAVFALGRIGWRLAFS